MGLRALKKIRNIEQNMYVKSVYKWMSAYKCPLYDHSWPFFRHMCDYLSQTWGSDGHFEVLNRSYLWLVEKLWRKTQIFSFLFFLRFCTKTDICIFFVFYIFLFFVITFVPIKIGKTWPKMAIYQLLEGVTK